ncbi:hypothetical protein FNV43_RR26739 [Rhamnella rubrinervis]|uniref:Pentatricopeptide repeat-containing protein n=1 Tax=Rhamnella rubrinervis TaxID=2594499 RepID=A0A8K0DJ46_9ROSA|nr:hypothetical protein FNV43_RR26739 [Rhamnella rubrinervis]
MIIRQRTTAVAKSFIGYFVPLRFESTDSQLVAKPTSPVNPDHLLRVCTILYQQQNSPESRLQSNLHACDFQLTHEFFLQVCNNFPFSWRPVYRFFNYTETYPRFDHTTVSFNKMVDVIGKSRNIDLFWEVLHEMGRRRLVNDKTFRIALKTLAKARELKKCVEFFHSMNAYGFEYSLGTLNKVVEPLYLIQGFCEVGGLIEASKIWNLMVDEGFEPDIDAVEKMMETLFKINRYDEAMKLFQSMRSKRMEDLGLSTYRLVIKWMCKRGKIAQAHLMFEEMHMRKIEADNLTLGSLLYGLLARGRVNRSLQGHLGKRGRKGHDALVNFDTIFVGGLVKAGKSLEATKYVERTMKRGLEVPRFDYNKFLHYQSNEEGVVMFEEVGKKLRAVGLVDLADILEIW